MYNYIRNEHGAIHIYILLWIMNKYRYCSEFEARQRCLHRLQLESMLPNTFVDFVRTHWISSPAVQFSFRTHQIKHVITCPCWKAVPQSFHHKLRHPVALNRVQPLDERLCLCLCLCLAQRLSPLATEDKHSREHQRPIRESSIC